MNNARICERNKSATKKESLKHRWSEFGDDSIEKIDENNNDDIKFKKNTNKKRISALVRHHIKIQIEMCCCLYHLCYQFHIFPKN